jgi:hypothetical protein
MRLGTESGQESAESSNMSRSSSRGKIGCSIGFSTEVLAPVKSLSVGSAKDDHDCRASRGPRPVGPNIVELGSPLLLAARFVGAIPVPVGYLINTGKPAGAAGSTIVEYFGSMVPAKS